MRNRDKCIICIVKRYIYCMGSGLYIIKAQENIIDYVKDTKCVKEFILFVLVFSEIHN